MFAIQKKKALKTVAITTVTWILHCKLLDFFSRMVPNGQMDHGTYRGMMGSDSACHMGPKKKIIEMNLSHSGVWWSAQSSADFNFETTMLPSRRMHVRWDIYSEALTCACLSLYKRFFVAINNVGAAKGCLDMDKTDITKRHHKGATDTALWKLLPGLHLTGKPSKNERRSLRVHRTMRSQYRSSRPFGGFGFIARRGQGDKNIPGKSSDPTLTKQDGGRSPDSRTSAWKEPLVY